MENKRRDGLFNPHWKADGSYPLSDQPPSVGTYKMPVKALNIIWGNDPRYWQWIKLSDEDKKSSGGFEEGAMLIQVNWIEVTGKLSTSRVLGDDVMRKYRIYYVVKFRIDAFGWHSVPIKLKLRVDGKEEVRNVLMEAHESSKWHEIYGGEFTASREKDRVVDFGMFEVESEWWKGGMIIAGIRIKPIN